MSGFELSDQERQFLRDTEFLLAKQRITDKLVLFLRNVEEGIKKDIEECRPAFPQGTLIKSGKISKGENYRGLPYLVLDYPRYSKNDDLMLFRTMIWWGNFISFTLHLQGNIFDQKREKILALIQEGHFDEFYLCVNNTPWEYHYGKDNYRLISELNTHDITAMSNGEPFIKLSTTIPLEEIESDAIVKVKKSLGNCLLCFS